MMVLSPRLVALITNINMEVSQQWLVSAVAETLHEGPSLGIIYLSELTVWWEKGNNWYIRASLLRKAWGSDADRAVPGKDLTFET